MAFHSFGGWKQSLFGDHHMHGPEGVKSSSILTHESRPILTHLPAFPFPSSFSPAGQSAPVFGFRCRRRGRWERLVEPTGTDWWRRARSLPLDRVATALGYRRDVTDKARWKRPGIPGPEPGPERAVEHAGPGLEHEVRSGS